MKYQMSEPVSPEKKDEIIQEFHETAIAQEYISQGGIHYAKQVLDKALGEDKAASIINRLTSSLQVRPFDFARKADPEQILNFIQHEHPQTIALILSYLDPVQSGQILSEPESGCAGRGCKKDRCYGQDVAGNHQ